MKNYTITEEQIKELAKGNKKVEKMFPEVFYKIGWYKSYSNENFLAFYDGKKFPYGITHLSEWKSNLFVGNGVESLRLATEEEVKTALIKEAEKRGFKNGVRVDAKNIGNLYYRNALMNSNNFNFEESLNQLCLGNYSVFKDGKWAEIIKNKYLTKKQAESKLTELSNDGYEYQIID